MVLQRKLGRAPKHTDVYAHPRLMFADHLRPSYTGYVPDNIDYSGMVDNWPMYLNDQLGDCTAADAGHGLELWTRYGQGKALTVSDNDIVSFYSGSTGYNPNNPTSDQGGNMQDVCNYFLKTGLAGHKIIAFFEVNVSDPDELRTALYLFGGVSIGMDFPAFAEDQFEKGQPWVPLKQNSQIEGGHDVLLVGMQKNGNYKVITWGRPQEVTPAFWDKYMASGDGEAWARVSQDWVNATGAIPAGLNVDSANQAFQQMTGRPGPFVQTTPAPQPNPDPEQPDPDDIMYQAFKTWAHTKGYE